MIKECFLFFFKHKSANSSFSIVYYIEENIIYLRIKRFLSSLSLLFSFKSKFFFDTNFFVFHMYRMKHIIYKFCIMKLKTAKKSNRDSLFVCFLKVSKGFSRFSLSSQTSMKINLIYLYIIIFIKFFKQKPLILI